MPRSLCPAATISTLPWGGVTSGNHGEEIALEIDAPVSTALHDLHILLRAKRRPKYASPGHMFICSYSFLKAAHEKRTKTPTTFFVTVAHD
jgi:hypothetical protein